MNLDLFSAEHLCSYFTDVSFHRVNVENGLDVSTSSNQRLLKRVSLYFFHFFIIINFINTNTFVLIASNKNDSL